MFLMSLALCIWLAVAYNLSEYRQKGWKLKIVCFGKHGTHFLKNNVHVKLHCIWSEQTKAWKRMSESEKWKMKNLKMPKLKNRSFENIYAIIIVLWASEGLRKSSDYCFQVRRKDVLYLLRYF